MSDTPRTDALLARTPIADLNRADLVNHARQLERELRVMTDYAELASDVIKRAKIMGERAP
jgi:hypothetical protein